LPRPQQMSRRCSRAAFCLARSRRCSRAAMAPPPFYLPLLLAFLLLSTAAAHSQHLHLQHHGHGPHHHHHVSPSMTATARFYTAPSMHQNRMESEDARQSLRVFSPFLTPVAAQAPSAEEAMSAMVAAADAGDPARARLDPPSPPSSLLAAGDLMPSSLPLLQPQAEVVGSFESEPAAPPSVVDEQYRDEASPSPPPPAVYEPYRDAASAPPSVVDEPYSDAASPPPPPFVVYEPYRDTASPTPPVVYEPYLDAASPPPPPPVVYELYRGVASPPPPSPVVYEPYRAASPQSPVHDYAAGVVYSGSGDDLGLQQIAKVLASLGYNEMASSATLLAGSASVATWPGPITVFAAPDVFLQADSCPESECSRRHLLLDHMALGYFPYAELAAAPTTKLPSASVGFCLDVAAQPQRGPFSVHHASLYVDGVMVSEPELYDDGRYVVHGLHGFIPPLSRASCAEDAHEHPHHQVHLHQHRRHHHLSARSSAASAAIAASAVRVMIREAISRLRDGGFGFVALAMRVKFAELEKLSNLTVFALNDQAIFTGEGHGYVSAVRFHIVPEHRLTRADLLRLRPGTILPTLAGEDQKLVVTLGSGSATDEVRINYIPVKEPDVVINSRVAVHGVYVPFPRLHLANLATLVAVASDLQTNDSCGGAGGPFGDCASTPMTSTTISADQGYGKGQ
jgi:hypothetical protein